MFVCFFSKMSQRKCNIWLNSARFQPVAATDEDSYANTCGLGALAAARAVYAPLGLVPVLLLFFGRLPRLLNKDHSDK